MATSTQYSPNVDLNKILLEAGASKTVYALVTPWTEAAKDRVFGNAGSAVRLSYLQQFREAWTGKQDSYHREFFETWLEWSKKAVDQKVLPGLDAGERDIAGNGAGRVADLQVHDRNR